MYSKHDATTVPTCSSVWSTLTFPDCRNICTISRWPLYVVAASACMGRPSTCNIETHIKQISCALQLLLGAAVPVLRSSGARQWHQAEGERVQHCLLLLLPGECWPIVPLYTAKHITWYIIITISTQHSSRDSGNAVAVAHHNPVTDSWPLLFL